MTTINLEFPKSETRLAGFPYGENVYQSQAKEKISFDEKITIIFPDQIEKSLLPLYRDFLQILLWKSDIKE